MSNAFNTISIHTLISKLLQTNIPGTNIKFIANYIKGRKAYTTYRNHISAINKLHVMQNKALRTATGCTQDTNIQHLHDETLPYFPYTSTSTTPHYTNRKHKHTKYINTTRLQTHYLQQRHALYTYIYCL